MEITTPNIDVGAAQTGQLKANQSRGKFEMVYYNPYEVKPKRSFLGGFLKVLGGLATPAFLFPGVGTLIGASGLAASGLGGHLQNKAARDSAQSAPGPVVMNYPGLSGALASDPALAMVAETRESALYSSSQGIK